MGLRVAGARGLSPRLVNQNCGWGLWGSWQSLSSGGFVGPDCNTLGIHMLSEEANLLISNITSLGSLDRLVSSALLCK